MFIQTETTPNPLTLKFLPGRPVVGGAPPVDYPSKKALATAEKPSKLATALFEIEGVERVFFGVDFISITKNDAVEWYVMKPAILGQIMEFFVTNQPLFDEAGAAAAAEAGKTSEDTTTKYDPEDEAVVLQIQELLDSRVRPAVAQDGGDIVFHSYQEGIVYLAMRGACSGCPSSTATLKMGIENMLKHYLPEIVEVRPAPAQG